MSVDFPSPDSPKIGNRFCEFGNKNRQKCKINACGTEGRIMLKMDRQPVGPSLRLLAIWRNTKLTHTHMKPTKDCTLAAGKHTARGKEAGAEK